MSDDQQLILAEKAHEAEVVDAESGPREVAPPSGEVAIFQPQPFAGIASEPFTTAQTAILLAEVPAGELDIKPTGEVYLPQVGYRRILNAAFGPGGWALFPRGDEYQLDGKTVCREFALFINGRFVAQAMGEADYIPNNPRITRATACESAKSNALMRCCKDVGIALQCWDRRYTEAWKRRHAVREQDGKWRRKDTQMSRDDGVAVGPASRQSGADGGAEEGRGDQPDSAPSDLFHESQPPPAKKTPPREWSGYLDSISPHRNKKGWVVSTQGGLQVHTFSPRARDLCVSAIADTQLVNFTLKQVKGYLNITSIDGEAVE